MSESTFKVGDIIKGKPLNPYSITTEKATMRVLSIDEDDEMRVRLQSHTAKPQDIGSIYTVSEKHFVLVSKVAKSIDTPFVVKGRRTFKALKAFPGVKKGQLFQEQCDDGTQPYSPLKGSDTEGLDIEFEDRKIVEQNPSWFVEVFEVSPRYMTKEEVDMWTAFHTKQVGKKIIKKGKK